jgi:hypothetical protein
MQRNPQSQIKTPNDLEKKGGHPDKGAHNNPHPSEIKGICPSCGTSVPPKPGFRFSHLKCPKCGKPMSKQ